MQDKVNGDSEQKSEGDIGDQLSKSQDARAAVQTKTFTKWMNVFLQRSDPPLAVHDLFTDIQDGRLLMALLEELSGCKLLYRFRSSPHRIFRLNNISKALAFLDDRHVRLLGIDASGIADGKPAVVLNLIWNIILYFQVKQVTGGLQRHLSSSLSSLSMSSYPSSSDPSSQPNDIGSYSCNTLPSKGRKAAREPKYQGRAIKTLLQWVQRCTSKFGVEVHDFGKSWRSGLAFLALIKSINPALLDLRESLSREPSENIQLALMIAHHSLDIPPLLEPEDVSCTSPDEKSIITYVSTFLRHCLGTDEDPTTHIEVPEIPNFGSLESVSLGETLTDDAEAQALLKGLKQSSEQKLWKKWTGRPSGSPPASLHYSNEAVTSDLSSRSGDIFSSCHISDQPVGSASTSPFNTKKGRSRSILKPVSPLDAGVVSHEIRSWMEKVSVDQGYHKPRRDESHFSLSSEEGIYSLSVLDSDEEEAYSYILDLNKEVFQPQLKEQVPRVEEEEVEEMFLNGRQTKESTHLESCGMLNGSGCKNQKGTFAQNDQSEVGAQSAIHRKSDCNKNESSSRELVNNRAVFDTESKEESRRREEGEEESAVRRQSNNDSNYYEEERKKEKTENASVTTHSYDKTEARLDEAKETKFLEDCWQKEPQEKTERVFFVVEKQVGEEEEEDSLTTFEGGQDRRLEKEEENQQHVGDSAYVVCGAGATKINTEEESEINGPKIKHFTCKDENKEEDSDEVKNPTDFEADTKAREEKIKRLILSVQKATTIDHLGRTTCKSDTYGGVNVHNGDTVCSATSQSFREGGFILQAIAPPCDITPLELETLLVLWILFYCYFIIPQMIL